MQQRFSGRVLKYNVIEGEKPSPNPREWVSPEIPYSQSQLENMVNRGIIPGKIFFLPWPTHFRREVLKDISLYTLEQARNVHPIQIEDLQREGYL